MTSTLFLNKEQHFCDERGQEERGGKRAARNGIWPLPPKENKETRVSSPGRGEVRDRRDVAIGCFEREDSVI